MINSKNALAALLMCGSLTAFAGAPHKVAYLTSWGLSDAAALEKSSVNTYMLSFGQWDEKGNISSSDDIVTIPAYDPYWMSPGYTAWTNLKFNDAKRQMLLAFGGQTYESIWSYIQTPESREILAKNIVDLLTTDFPVYAKHLTADKIVDGCLSVNWDGSCNFGVYQKAGTVQLDGVDFDFEKAARITAEENANLLALVKRIRELAPGKTMSLTTYHVGADPVECANNAVVENCSYIETDRSSHHGEVSELLAQSKDIFNFFNVMTYDAGKNFKYQVALQNYANILGDKKKVVLGNTINAQWSPDGPFVETDENNVARAKWQAENGFGGLFVWNFGASTEQLSMVTQVAKVNAMIEAMSAAQTPAEPGTPTTPVTPPVAEPARQESITVAANQALRAINVGTLLQSYKQVNAVTRDGAWVGTISLPVSGVAEGSVFKLTRTATYSTDIVSKEYGIDTPLLGETRTYTFTNGAWTADAITLSKNAQLRALENQVDGLSKYLRTVKSVTMVVSDGNWTGNIHLPAAAREGSVVKLVRNSSWATNLFVNGTAVVIARGTSVEYEFKSGAWAPRPVEMTYAAVLQALANSPETFRQQLLEAQKINAVFQIKP